MAKRWAELYLNCLRELDCMCEWNFRYGRFVEAENIFGKYHPNSHLISNLGVLTPFFEDLPWTKSLEGRRVLVVHPFEKSIRNQYARREHLFENPDILQSINIAKWHIWLACVSDLSLFAGQCMYQSGKLSEATIQQLLPSALQQLLAETGEPEEAGSDFVGAREKIVQRISSCDWKLERDDETVFSQSPEALFYWSPIADELKERDETIVKNSIRFRWIEVRRSVREMLDFEALAQASG